MLKRRLSCPRFRGNAMNRVRPPTPSRFDGRTAFTGPPLRRPTVAALGQGTSRSRLVASSDGCGPFAPALKRPRTEFIDDQVQPARLQLFGTPKNPALYEPHVAAARWWAVTHRRTQLHLRRADFTLVAGIGDAPFLAVPRRLVASFLRSTPNRLASKAACCSPFCVSRERQQVWR